MVVVLGVLAVVAALSAAAFANATGDILPRKQGKERKSAYAAAEAGVNFYLSRLNQDSDYWTKCGTGPAPNATEPNPVVQPWNGTGTDTRIGRQRVVPGDTSKYVVELLPAAPATACVAGPSSASMIEQGTGRLRIRATGYAGASKRSIIATMRRKSFADFIYFTDYETRDPATYGQNAALAEQYCHFYRAQRNSLCSEIQFADGDRINGPFHTNDDILACGSPDFGRSPADRIEISGPAPGGFTKPGGCSSAAPTFLGTKQIGAAQLAVPSSNAKITSEALAAYTFTGRTTILFNGTPSSPTMTVTRSDGTTSTMAMPSNGVIWVKNGTCPAPTSTPPEERYTAASGCAIASVSGSYAKSATVVSDRDILITNSVTRNTGADSLLGLIATNNVRVQHPVTFPATKVPYNQSGANSDIYGNFTQCTETRNPVRQDRTIEAAILSLEHSFLVDNWGCGQPLGTLTVTGAIAQRYRGPVGTGSDGGTSTGYVKNYTYDDRLRFRNPPFFLDPVAAGWRVIKLNEQVPAR